MAERPMLFSAPMVRALLREIDRPGSGKTQTRRALTQRNVTVLGEPWGKRSPWAGLRFDEAAVRSHSPISGAADCHLAVPFCHPADEPTATEDCGVYRVRPVIEVGDTIWVRESIDTMAQSGDSQVAYMADWPGDPRGLGWRPSIHMPRWACRILLDVTDVRVQRLHDISEDDAIAEGCQRAPGGVFVIPGQYLASDATVPRTAHSAVSAYGSLWRQINGPGSWDANPWVVAYSFRPRMAREAMAA